MILRKRPRVICDTECYPNYWLAKFRRVDTGQVVSVEMYRHIGYREAVPLNVGQLKAILERYTLVTFNGNKYDIPMILKAMQGATNAELKRFSDTIITRELWPWESLPLIGYREVPTYIDHIDLIEVAPGDGSLKLYGGRVHSRKLQDLPYDIEKELTREQANHVSEYCGNDLQTTYDLLVYVKEQIELREQMTEMYGTDLRSKSDAQIAEAVFKKKLGDILGKDAVGKVYLPPGFTFKFKPLPFLKFKTPSMQERYAKILADEFELDEFGKPIEPPSLYEVVEQIGDGRYRMGIGGLHSSETCAAYFADEEWMLMDIDVSSYYPRIILNNKLAPKHLGDNFLRVYRDIFDTRIAAKRAGNKVVEKVLKIVLNGSFGKFGSNFSSIYAPDLMVQVTVTGQLSLLMLIEEFVLNDVQVLSANTDGIVLRFRRKRLEEVRSYIKAWEQQTGFEMEETYYKTLASRDVNNYIAVKDRDYYRNILNDEQFAKMEKDGWVKGKGDYAEITISKNPSFAICGEAVKAFLLDGTPIAQTIFDCRDIRKFLHVERVTGGAVKVLHSLYDESLKVKDIRPILIDSGWFEERRGKWRHDDLTMNWPEPISAYEAYRINCGEDKVEYLGKVVRFYRGRYAFHPLRKSKMKKDGNRSAVPDSAKAVAMMELSDQFPDDIDYDSYLERSNRILELIGVRASEQAA
jgi:hypothetical protein